MPHPFPIVGQSDYLIQIVDIDSLTNSANWYGSTLFAKAGISGFSRTRVNNENKILKEHCIVINKEENVYLGACVNWNCDICRLVLASVVWWALLGCVMRRCVFGHMGQQRPRSDCMDVSTESDWGLHCLLTESLETAECMNGEQWPRW